MVKITLIVKDRYNLAQGRKLDSIIKAGTSIFWKKATWILMFCEGNYVAFELIEFLR